jgi:acetyl esterase/lipase
MSRISLHIKAVLFRFFQTIGRYCDIYLSTPLPQTPSFKRRILANVSNKPGLFDLLFYTPPGYFIQRNASKSANQQTKKYPVLINFHGGGYTIGHAADDARWATEVIKRTGAVVIGVGYRLAPSYPFPLGIQDCVSAILWVWEHAEEFNIDLNRTALSGFSAGGNFTYTASYMLYEELKRLKREDRLGDVEVGRVVGLASFYPSCDWTMTREERAATNPNFTPIIPPILMGLFEGSYLYPARTKEEMAIPLLSPGLAPDELVKEALPQQMVLITCWGDGLLVEAERFRGRLRGLGKRVDGFTVKGVPHGWDKWPSWWKGDPKRDEAYRVAAESLGEFFTMEV